jgi:hypothetical protein
LLRVYAKCVAGQQDEAKRRILDATKSDTDASPPAGADASAADSDGEPDP